MALLSAAQSRNTQAGGGVRRAHIPQQLTLIVLTGLWIFLPAAGLTAILFLILRIPEQVKKDAAWHTIQRLHHKIDFIGFALFTPACIMFLLAMSWGGSRYGWDSATIIGLFVGSAAITGLFGCWVGHYKDRALIPPEVLFKPVVLYGCLVSFLQGGAFLMLNYYLPLWFQSVKGASPERGGVMMLPTCVSQIVSGAICAALRMFPISLCSRGTDAK